MLDSQIVEAAEEKVKFFILQDFWPAFKVFQSFGFFPITKVIDENGNISLQPTKIWKSVLIQSIWMLVLFLPYIGKLKSRSFDFFGGWLKMLTICFAWSKNFDLSLYFSIHDKNKRFCQNVSMYI